MSTASLSNARSSSELSVKTFPLERPALRVRHRGTRSRSTPTNLATQQTSESLLPYFVAGDENRLAAFVCQSDSAFSYGQPLLLIGDTGTGKSALALHLAARECSAKDLGDSIGSVKYYTAADFARDYASAVDADDLMPLRAIVDGAPILIIDDLQGLAGKAAAQEELAIRIDGRLASGKPTILTCRRLPSETAGIRPRLASRTLMGLTVPLRPPAGDTRITLLREISVMRGLQISDDLLRLLDAGLPMDLPVRSLDAVVKQIDLLCRMNECQVDAKTVSGAIESLRQGDEVEISKIVRVVARLLGLRSNDLRSSTRKQSVVRARSLAMYLSRRMTTKSLDQIGKYFGGRDHSTVLHAIRKTESLLATDAELSRAAADAADKLSG
ncbi:helix-turn-helix domain-containing protein [Stieleria varia]|uniref:Chromosomal replication initiator protein DnaA n=1 Tax=Stieleria varia TaxID=2528005 RepID=A0A5C6A032_9BACT|nr:helix-turn-helix domain-containing protein [Stieleria varia]TWT92680.1 Chromosomal replication initiator protein DnaA [Stieleria varia]